MKRALIAVLAPLLVLSGGASAQVTKDQAWDAVKQYIMGVSREEMSALYVDQIGVVESSAALRIPFKASGYDGFITVDGENVFNILNFGWSKGVQVGSFSAVNQYFGMPQWNSNGDVHTDAFNRSITLRAFTSQAGSSDDTYMGYVRWSRMYGLKSVSPIQFDSCQSFSADSWGQTPVAGPGMEGTVLSTASAVVDAVKGSVAKRSAACESFFRAVALSQLPDLQTGIINSMNKLKENDKPPSDYMSFAPAVTLLDSGTGEPAPGGSTGGTGTSSPACTRSDGTVSGNPYDCAPKDSETNCPIIDLFCNFKKSFIPSQQFLNEKMPTLFTQQLNMPTQVTDKIDVMVPLFGQEISVGLTFTGLMMNDTFKGIITLMAAYGAFFWLLRMFGIPNMLENSAGSGEISESIRKAGRITARGREMRESQTRHVTVTRERGMVKRK